MCVCKSFPISLSGFFHGQTVLRVWDCLFYEGSKVLFRVALTLIMHHRPEILRARSLPDLCQCFRQITSGAFSLDCHSFMQVGGSYHVKNLEKYIAEKLVCVIL